MVEFDDLSLKDKIAHWSETEAVLKEALAIVTGALTSETARLVEEYLTHNELGLALEILEDGIAELGIKPSTQLTEKLNIARARMGYAAAENLEAPK